MTCTKQHDHAQVRCPDCASASAKRGAKATHAGLADEERRAEARAQIVAINRVDTREWWSSAQRRQAVRRALEKPLEVQP